MRNLWSDSCAETFSAAPISADTSADLVIIGGGYSGCSAALEAAGQGARVILLEGQQIGYGGSGRNVGLVNAGLWLPPDQVRAQMGTQAGDRLNQALAAGPETVFDLIRTHDIQCEPVRNGTLHCAHSLSGRADLENRYAQQAVRNAPVSLLNMNDTVQATGSKRFHGALRDLRAGTIQPLAYARGLARAAVSAGAIIHENSPVISVQRQNEWTIRTAQATIRAPKLFLATNAYHLDIHGLARSPLIPVHFFQMATAPLPDRLRAQILPGQEGCWDTGLVMSSFRLDQAGRFILGAMGLPDRLGIHFAWARRALVHLFPQLGDMEFEHFWSGRIGMTQDHIPRIQRLEPHGYSVFGYSGRGISPGTVFGRACAKALLCGQEADLPIAPVAQHHEGLTQLKGAYYETGARMIHLSGHRFQ